MWKPTMKNVVQKMAPISLAGASLLLTILLMSQQPAYADLTCGTTPVSFTSEDSSITPTTCTANVQEVQASFQQAMIGQSSSEVCGLVTAPRATTCPCGSNPASVNIALNGGDNSTSINIATLNGASNPASVNLTLNSGSDPANVSIAFNGGGSPTSVNIAVNGGSDPASVNIVLNGGSDPANVSITINPVGSSPETTIIGDDGLGTEPGNPDNQGGDNQTHESQGNTTKGNNGVGNGEDPQPPGNPPINDGLGTDPGNHYGNLNHESQGNTTKGNNGVGNGEDPQPPGNPPINDGPGTGPGNPGNRGGLTGEDTMMSGADKFIL